jgi:cytochrome c peroxidase
MQQPCGIAAPASYFHDGSAATLEDAASIYNAKRSLGLSDGEVADLAQYLESL